MYLHDFDVAFCVNSNVAEWEDLAPTDVMAALRRRVEELTEDEVLEAVGFLNTISLDDPETEDAMKEATEKTSGDRVLSRTPSRRVPTLPAADTLGIL